MDLCTPLTVDTLLKLGERSATNRVHCRQRCQRLEKVAGESNYNDELLIQMKGLGFYLTSSKLVLVIARLIVIKIISPMTLRLDVNAQR